MKERTKHQRYANKKNEEMRALLQEVTLLLLYKSHSQHCLSLVPRLLPMSLGMRLWCPFYRDSTVYGGLLVALQPHLQARQE